MENNSFTFNSKRFGFGIAFMLLLMSIASSAFEHAISQTDSNDLIGKSISQNKDIHQTYDVLFMGDSRTHQGMDPHVFTKQYVQLNPNGNLLSYNLGRPGMQSPFIYLVLLDYLRHADRPPQAIFLNISFYLLYGEGWLRDVYLTYYTPNLSQAITFYQKGWISFRDTGLWYVGSRLSFLRYRKRARNIFDNFALNPGQLKNDRAGWKKLQAQFLEKSNYGYVSRGFNHITPEAISSEGYRTGLEDQRFLDSLTDVFALAKKFKMPIFIYEFPWPQEIQSPEFDHILSYYRDIQKNLSANNTYIHFIEYDYYWPIELFVDPLHLNQPGADKLSALAAQWLTEFQRSQQTQPANP